MKEYKAGIDIGSTTIKLVILDESNTTVYKNYVRHHAQTQLRLSVLLKDVLAKVGGFDIAAMTGAFLGGALYHVPVVMDGLISSVAALCAARLCPYVKEYLIASHVTAEPAGKHIMEECSCQQR